jgi:hypothetical protein
MGRAAEQLKDFPVWTTIFMLHGVAELALGAMKLQGYYNFEKGEVIRDLKDLKDGDKKNKMYVEQRVKLMQYTRYHGLSRMALGLIAILAVAFDGVEGTSVTGGLLPLGLGFTFWHGSAALVVIVHLSTYPDHAKITGTFFVHLLLAAGFAAFCVYGTGAKIV